MRRVMLLSVAAILVAGCANLVGPPGPMGATGPQGPRGYTSVGPAGQTGRTGPRGLEGSAGATGDLGPTGARGATGVAGAEGQVGRAGTTGAVGARGAKGATGANGAANDVYRADAQAGTSVVEPWTAYREFNFDPTRTDIRNSEMDRVNEIATYLSQSPSVSLGIDGTMDARRFNQSDRDLGVQRAESVRDALIQAGVPAQKIRLGAFADPNRRYEGQVQVVIEPRT